MLLKRHVFSAIDSQTCRFNDSSHSSCVKFELRLNVSINYLISSSCIVFVVRDLQQINTFVTVWFAMGWVYILKHKKHIESFPVHVTIVLSEVRSPLIHVRCARTQRKALLANFFLWDCIKSCFNKGAWGAKALDMHSHLEDSRKWYENSL